MNLCLSVVEFSVSFPTSNFEYVENFSARNYIPRYGFNYILGKFMKLFERRLISLLILLLVWSACASGALLYYSVYARGRYLEAGQRLALRRGDFQATRGRILDRNGVSLAWSERYFDLYILQAKSGGVTPELIIKAVRDVVPDCEVAVISKTSWLLKTALTPSQILNMEPLMRSYPELTIQARTERRTVDYLEIKHEIGETVDGNGVLVGISGAELTHNSQLSGVPGTYEVMLDRRRNWIPGTWRLVKPVVPGRDVKLEFSIAELITTDSDQ